MKYTRDSLYVLGEVGLSFLANSSVLISLVACSLLLVVSLVYNSKLDFVLFLISFLITFAIYNTNKLTDVKEDFLNLPSRAHFVHQYRRYLLCATIASFFLAFFLSFLKSPFALAVVLYPCLIGVLYSVKIKNFRIKDLLLIKNITVTSTWVISLTLLPLAVSPQEPFLILLIASFIFVIAFVNTFLFDVRDVSGDSDANVKTLPACFGIKNTKKILLALNSLLIPLLIIVVSQKMSTTFVFVLIFSLLYGYWIILRFCKDDKQPSKDFDIFVDGEFVLLAFLTLLFTLFCASPLQIV